MAKMAFTKCKNRMLGHDVIDLPMVQITIETKAFLGMLDSTSKRTLAGPALIEYLRGKGQYTTLSPISDAKHYSRYGAIIPREEASVRMTWVQSAVYQGLIYMPELTCDLILGRDFMQRSNIVLNFPRGGWSYTTDPRTVYVFEQICQCCNVMPNWRLFIKKCTPYMLAIPKPVFKNEKLMPGRVLRHPTPRSDDDSGMDTGREELIIDLTDAEVAELKRKIMERNALEAKASGDKLKTENANNTSEAQPVQEMENRQEIPEFKKPLPVAADKPIEESLQEAAQSKLDEINRIYDILDNDVTEEEHKKWSGQIRTLLAQYRSINQKIEKMELGN